MAEQQTVSIVLNSRAEGQGVQATITGLQGVQSAVEKAGLKLVIFTKVLDAGIEKFKELFSGFNIQAALQQADAFGKLAQKIGTTTDETSKLVFAFRQSGVEQTQLQLGFKNLAEWMAKNGREGHNLTEEFMRQADAIAALSDGDEKLRAVQDRFGKGADNLIPTLNKGSAGMREMLAEAERLGPVTEQQARAAEVYHDTLGSLNVAMTALARTIGTQFLGAQTQMVRGFTDATVAIREFLEGHRFIIETIGSYLKLAVVIGALSTVMYAFRTAIMHVMSALVLANVSLLGFKTYAIDTAVIVPKLTAALMGLAAAAAAAYEGFRMVKAMEQEGKAAGDEAEQTRRLAQSIRDVTDARLKDGTMRLRDYVEYRAMLSGAIGLDPSKRLDSLKRISGMLAPAADANAKKALTQEQIEKQRSLLDLEIEENRLNNEEQLLRDGYLASIDIEMQLLRQKRDIVMQGLAQGVLPEAVARQMMVDDGKAMLAIRQKDYEQAKKTAEQQLKQNEQELKDAEERLELLRKTHEEERQHQIDLTKWIESNRDSQLSAIYNDPFLTQIEKRTQALKVLQEFKKSFDAEPDRPGFSEASAATGGQIDSINAQGDPASFMDQFRIVRKQLQDEWGSMAQQMASSFANVFNSAINSISNGIMGLIQGTMTWGEALRNIGSTILQSVVQAIVRIGVQFVVTQLMMFLFGKIIAAASLKTTAAIASKTAVLWAPAATAAAIATFGGATAAAASVPIAAGVNAGILAGMAAFQDGGTIEGGRQIIQVNEAGTESILNARATAMLGTETINAINSGGANLALLRSLAIDPYALQSNMANNILVPGATAPGSSGSVSMSGGGGPQPVQQLQSGGGGPQSVTIILVDSRQSRAFMDGMESSAGRAKVIEIVRDGRLEVGVQ